MSLLRDPDYVALMQMGKPGRSAFSIFVSLILAAKDQDNGGVFREPLRVVAGRIQVSNRALLGAIGVLTLTPLGSDSGAWLEVPDDAKREGWMLRIRSYDVWNKDNWGGARAGAGRQSGSNPIQDGIKTESVESTPARVTVKESSSSDSSPNSERARELVPPGSADEVSPSERYVVEACHVAIVVVAIPRNRRRNGPGIDRAVRDAIVRIRRDGHAHAVGPPHWLANRIAAYYASPEGRGRFFREPSKWLDAKGYDEPDEAWAGREEPKKEVPKW